jgi:hypothetical protein
MKFKPFIKIIKNILILLDQLLFQVRCSRSIASLFHLLRVFLVSVVCYLFFLSCCVLDFILTLYLWVFLVSVVCYLFFLSCCANDTHQEHPEIQCKYEIQHTTWQDKQITNDTHQEHPEIQCKYEIQHLHCISRCSWWVSFVTCLSCHVVCWISCLHCISGCSWWVSFVICFSCHVVCWISCLHCISGCSWRVSFCKYEIQHTTWQDKQITNDTHQEHTEIQCKYEIQHTTW